MSAGYDNPINHSSGQNRHVKTGKCVGIDMRQLDPSEFQALRLFANGRTTDEIAAVLEVRKEEAAHYLRVAARKLKARNRVHAVAIAIRAGLIRG